MAPRPRRNRRDRRIPARVSRSTPNVRAIASSSAATSSPTARSPTRNGANSSKTAAMKRRLCGFRTAGRGSQQESIAAPLYWSEDGTEFTLGGRRAIDWAAPVANVSYFEADAFARWAGARLPTEAEWEDFSASADPRLGNQLDEAGPVAPAPGGGVFGDVWEWTAKRIRIISGFHSAPRAPSASITASS